MERCLKVSDDHTAINKSYACLHQLSSNGSTSSECYFLFEQQFNRPHWYCGYVEMAIAFALSLACYPANAIAIVNFKRRRVKPAFLVLIATVAVTNMAIATSFISRYIARVTTNYPFGTVGCIVNLASTCTLKMFAVWVLTVLSFERRRCIMSQFMVETPKLWKLILLLVGLGAVSATVWILIGVNYVVVEHAIIGSITVDVCLVKTSAMPHEGFLTAVLALTTFILPLILTTLNYINICWYARRHRRASTSTIDSADSVVTSSSAASSSSVSFVFPQQKRRDFVIALTMGLSLLELAVFMLPIQVALGLIWFDMSYNKYLQLGAVKYLGDLFIILDCIVNPLWTSFIPRPAHHRKQSNAEEVLQK